MNQTELFPPFPYLESALGEDAFESIPQQPGIYHFYDAESVLIYVGKAKNLRRRLFSYKRASAGRTSRKESALIRRIQRFEFNVLPSETEAFLHENRWIRECRPEFNHQNKHVETYYYIILYQTNRGLGLEYSMRPAVPLISRNGGIEDLEFLMQPDFEIETAQLFGCFKGHRSVRIHLGNLLRLIWLTIHETANPSYLPPQLSRNLTPKTYFFDIDSPQIMHIDKLYSQIEDWFTGRSPDLVYYLIQRISGIKSDFQHEYLCSVAENLLSYFDCTLATYGKQINEKQKAGKSGLIFQDELDDLIVRIKY